MAERHARGLLSHSGFKVAVAVLSLWCAAPSGCGGGGGSSAVNGDPADPKQVDPGSIANASLTAADVNTIVLQAINEANARGKPAWIAVVDRVGNVLTVTQMSGAPPNFTITDNDIIARNPAPTTGLLNQTVVPPNFISGGYAAISKAISGAYLSSNGNAFSTRTANQIVQEHFNPGVNETPAGPLFGVQFSQLTCSDFNRAPTPTTTSAGPHSSPLGFSADAGGLPIYKNGVLVGGIGVMSKGTYSLNPDVLNLELNNDDEEIAIAGVTGYEAPSQIVASNIAVGGIALRYQDGSPAQLKAPVAATGTFTPTPVPGFFVPPGAGTAYAGLTYGSPDGASGAVKDGVLGPRIYPNTTIPVYVFTDGTANILYQPTAGAITAENPAGVPITAEEARALETSALNVALSARAAIRNPTNSFAQVTVTVVDINGNVLAQARTPDAPIFGSDVSRQKARSAVFFSRSGTNNAQNQINGITAISPSTNSGAFADYITAAKAQVNPQVFTDGIAWSEVAVGDISRPFFPDGINNADLNNPNLILNTTPGALSLTFNKWSVFSTGLQLDLVAADILVGILNPPQQAGCARNGVSALSPVTVGTNNVLPGLALGGKSVLANGLQIFSGGFPVYRIINGNPVLVGGVGISGDGIQQDSMISFLGIKNGPSTLTNAPPNIRVDTLQIQGIQPRYANCPANPFLNQVVGNPCDGF
jgi:uncharacterized protein GlcG (DUF336 family)